ncbi:MAG TPA: LysR family transcriptional regulator, partial [Kofleriaceae bacterium]|nr:LysR family transcriptional regulator [Kofleriaceae bacterium]
MQFDNLASLALFAEVARLRSFSEAARQAGIAKSAVSKRIARLEDELGVRLLRRSTRTLALTDEGVRVYEHCAAIVAAA